VIRLIFRSNQCCLECLDQLYSRLVITSGNKDVQAGLSRARFATSVVAACWLLLLYSEIKGEFGKAIFTISTFKERLNI